MRPPITQFRTPPPCSAVRSRCSRLHYNVWCEGTESPSRSIRLNAFDLLKKSPNTVDWFYVSPPADFGAWLNTPSKGRYEHGGDVLLNDQDGVSTISAADLALAILDEVETPIHRVIASQLSAIS